MLPFQKRSVQGHQADDISTEDVVEVVHKVRHAANAALSSRNLGSTLRSNEGPGAASRRHGADRRVPAPIPVSPRAHSTRMAPVMEQYGEDEDEMTCLMPAKGLIIPPPATRRAPVAKVMSSNTSFRPAPLPRMAPQAPVSRAPMYASREATPHDARSMSERRIHRAQPMAVVAARQETAVVPAAPASLAPMAMPLVDSEPHINPGATVLTARSLKSRPTASWAAALVAMGIFAGLVTAAVARGDFSTSDSKVAAAAQVTGEQVIPAQPQSQPAASPVLPSSYMPTSAAPMAISAPAQANAVASDPPVAVAAKLSPTPKAAPKAAAPTVHVSHAAPPAAEKSEAKVEAKSDVKEEKKVASKGKKDKDDSSMASAKEAQALADAQLAASL